MALVIHVGSHPDRLVAELCEMLASPPADPFAREVVAAPTRGIERWLTQRIASGLGRIGTGDGICANVEFPSPRRLVREIMSAVPDLAAAMDAWSGPALTATVLAVLDEHVDEEWMWMLARFIEGPLADPVADLGNDRRLRAARKIAGLFGRYDRRRPGMVRAWLDGRDVDPREEALSGTDAWQPRLWRLVRERIGIPGMAELIPSALAPIRDGSAGLDLPERIFVYGLTAIDPLDLSVLDAAAVHREVHLYALHASPALWRQTGRRLATRPVAQAPPDRASDPTAGLARHPLLRSWAQESRELQFVLAARGITGKLSPPEQAGRPPAGLLARLQHDIRSNRSPIPFAMPGGPDSRASDRSIQIHVCYGPRRQVEVLRDAILHLFAADDTLEPRDVVIMTPDLATFAPLLEAVFLRETAYNLPDPPDRIDDGTTGTASLPDLRLRIADRAPAVTNPLVRFAATVLDLAGSRLEGGAIRELVAMPVVRRLFGIDEETAERIAGLIDDANVRWGLDADHRVEWAAGEVADHTWRRGLDRALAAVFYADSSVRVVDAIAPLSGVEGQEADPAGVLAQIIDRIVAVREILGKPRPLSEWAPAIAGAVRLLAAPDWEDQWQWSGLERLLDESFPAAGRGSGDPLIRTAEARLLVDDWSRDVPSPLHFRTGDITVCTPAPMRSVPYRVVCLLGMDDQRFPRSGEVDGDDLLVDNEIVGDSDRGAEDRQLLLDALMAAGDYLIVTYSGRDELTNAEFPPSTPIAELRDLVKEMAADTGSTSLVTHHPLQPFSESNFRPGALKVPGPWGFDPAQLDGAITIHHRRGPRPVPFLPPSPDAEMFSEIQLDDLQRFLEHPAREFLRRRLGFVIPARGEIPDDSMPTALDPLSEWKVTDRLLAGLLKGHSIESLEAHEQAGDTLPPGLLGLRALEKARDRAVTLSRAAVSAGHDPAGGRQYTGSVLIGGRGCLVEGSVEADPAASRLDVVTPSRLKGKQRLRVFLQTAFLSALAPQHAWYGWLLGRHLRGDKLWSVKIGPLPGDSRRRRVEAERLLARLVGLYVEGLEAPLPMPCETSFEWQRKIGSDRRIAESKARQAWETDRFSPEGKDPANEFLFHDLAEMSALQLSSFPANAERLWGPILPLLREKPP